MKTFFNWLLVLILSIAGIIHLIKPETFLVAMPTYIPFHLPIIYFTGVLELLFAIGLIIDKYRFITSWALVMYFIAILPAHFHVALNGIPMFGIKVPFILWARVTFQFVFIYWAFKLRWFRFFKKVSNK